MKRLTAIILLITFTSLNTVSASCNYSYTTNDNIRIVVPQNTNSVEISKNSVQNMESQNGYNYVITNPNSSVTNIEIQENSYQNTTKQPTVIILSEPDNYYAQNQYYMNPIQEEPAKETFSEKHPILSTLGTATLIAGVLGAMVAVAAIDNHHHNNYDQPKEPKPMNKPAPHSGHPSHNPPRH